MTFQEYCDKHNLTAEQISDLGDLLLTELQDMAERTQKTIDRVFDRASD